MKPRDAKCRATHQRPRQRHPPSASLSGQEDGGGVGWGGWRGGRGEGRVGEGGRGGVLPKKLKSGSGYHRLEVCGSSNGRHKLA